MYAVPTGAALVQTSDLAEGETPRPALASGETT